MTPTKSFREYSKKIHTVRSTVTEREAREGILRDIAGEWNERSPLVEIQHSSVSLPILINENNTIKDKRRMRANVNMNISLITGKKI